MEKEIANIFSEATQARIVVNWLGPEDKPKSYDNQIGIISGANTPFGINMPDVMRDLEWIVNYNLEINPSQDLVFANHSITIDEISSLNPVIQMVN